MSRIMKVQATNETQQETLSLLKTLEKKMGRVPNIFLHMAQSPITLQTYLTLSESASKLSLSPMLQEKIALKCAEANQCHYCLSAHTAIAKAKGLTDEDILLSRKGSSPQKKEEAILDFVKKIIEKKGHVSEEDVTLLKAEHVTDQEVVEIILVTVLNMFTNYFNNIVKPEIDFPKVSDLS